MRVGARFSGIGQGLHQNLGDLTSIGERIELVGGANTAYPFDQIFVNSFCAFFISWTFFRASVVIVAQAP